MAALCEVKQHLAVHLAAHINDSSVCVRVHRASASLLSLQFFCPRQEDRTPPTAIQRRVECRAYESACSVEEAHGDCFFSFNPSGKWAKSSAPFETRDAG